MFTNKRKLIWWISVPAVIILLVILFQMPTQKNSGKQANNSGKGFSAFFPLGTPGGLAGKSIFSGAGQMSYVQIIEGLKSGEINLVWEIWSAREACAEGTPPESCDKQILDMILSNYPKGEAERLKELISRYFSYEDAIRKLDLPENMKFDEKYAKIKAKRREVLSEDMAKLIFGQEEVQIDFTDGVEEFKNKTKNMRGDERVAAYEDFKRKTYGQYHNALVKREDKYDNYQTEIDLRDNDFKKQNPGTKTQSIREIRERYFGKSATEKMEQAEKEANVEQQKIEQYEAEVAKLFATKKHLDEKEKDETLKALREKIMGKEEAEAYDRRKAIEKLEQETFAK